MIEAVLLIFDSNGTWMRIVRAQRGVVAILARFLLPLLIITCAIEGYGLVRWGKPRDAIFHTRIFSRGEATVFETGQVLMSLALVFLGGALLKSMASTFHARHTFPQTFTVIAYAL